MGPLIGQYLPQPFHVPVREIASHRAVAVDIYQAGKHQKPRCIHFRLVRDLLRAFHNFPVIYI